MREQVTNFTGTMWVGLTSAFTSFMNFIPALLGALLILVAGWFVAKFVGALVERVLITMRLERVAESANISGYLPHFDQRRKPTLSAFIATVAKWFVFLIFVQAAVVTLGIAPLTGIINSIILFIPNIVVAAIILVAGAWAAKYVSGLVASSTARMNLGKSLAALTRYGILGFAFIAAVSQLGIATNLINILFTGLVASLALAFGLAFGLGGQSAASDITRSLLDRTRGVTGPTAHMKVNEPDIDDQLSHH